MNGRWDKALFLSHSPTTRAANIARDIVADCVCRWRGTCSASSIWYADSRTAGCLAHSDCAVPWQTNPPDQVKLPLLLRVKERRKEIVLQVRQTDNQRLCLGQYWERGNRPGARVSWGRGGSVHGRDVLQASRSI
jgi:hypothetical protein